MSETKLQSGVEVLGALARLVARSGAASLEFGWHLPDVPEDQQPDDVADTEPVVWTATGTWTRLRQDPAVRVGASDPTASHYLGGVQALTRLLAHCGVTCTVLPQPDGVRVRLVGTLRRPR